MTETPQERVARLQHEVDQAKIDDLSRQLGRGAGRRRPAARPA